MKKTGSTKKSTRELIVGLEKKGKASKENLWKDIAKRLGKPTRSRVKVNLWKINKAGNDAKGKVIVVPGKVLGTGAVDGALKVAAFEFSEKAIKKIEAGKGSAITLSELIDSKTKAADMVIIG